MTLEKVCGPYAILGSQQDTLCGAKFMVHLALQGAAFVHDSAPCRRGIAYPLGQSQTGGCLPLGRQEMVHASREAEG